MSLNSTFIVVDDHPVYRHGVVALVMQELHLESVGEAATIGEATELLIKENLISRLSIFRCRAKAGLILFASSRMNTRKPPFWWFRCMTKACTGNAR